MVRAPTGASVRDRHRVVARGPGCACAIDTPACFVRSEKGMHAMMPARVLRWQDNQNVPAPRKPATGTLLDDSLAVRYDLIMILDDFEDAVYLRTPSRGLAEANG